MPPLVRWTPPLAWLFSELARRALVATLDDGARVRADDADPRFSVGIAESAGEVSLTLGIDADRARLAIEAEHPAGHRWRDTWALEIARADGGEVAILHDRAAPIDLAEPRAPRIARLRVRRLALGDLHIPLADEAFHRFTRQSSEHVPDAPLSFAPWASSTAPEDAPWWEIDLGKTMALARIRVDLAAAPAGARLAILAYGFATPAGEPPPGSTLREVAAVRSLTVEDGVVARFVRVTLVAPPGERVSLAVTGVEILGAELLEETLAGTMRRAFSLFRDRPLSASPALRYGEVRAQSTRLARALARRLEPSTERLTVAVMTRNRPEWIVANLAALERGYLFAPLAPNEPQDRLAAILSRLRPACVICEPAAAHHVARLLPTALVVVCDDDRADAPFDALAAEEGDAPAPTPRTEDDAYVVLFTSGSTGTPKGALRSYAGVRAMLEHDALGHSPRHVSFQPLSHVSEFRYLPAVLVHGGLVSFSRGGAYLTDELRAFEPTTLGAVPRLFDVLYARYRRRLTADVAATPDVPRAAIEARALAEARAAFGGRLLVLSVGSAPVSPEVLAFLRRCFADLWVSEGYGTTELGTIAVDGKIADHVEVKLVPEPGAPPSNPERGEIHVRTPHLFAGYLGDGDEIDPDGFFPTGDLGERDATGRLRVVGRLRSAVKLAQGEFVAAERIEGALATTRGIDRVYVHAAPGAPGVAAAVVLERGETDERVALAALRAHGRAAGLAPYELPRGVLVVPELPLTGSGKLARSEIATSHGATLDALARGDAPTAGEDASAAEGELLQRVVRVASRAAGHALDPRDPLGAGLDSLAAAETLAALSCELGREVPLALWFEAATLEDLAIKIERFGAGRAATTELAAADRRLPSPATPPASGDGAGAILLTGATGFLGAHLVEALATRGREVICLVRAGSDAEAQARLTAALATRGVPRGLRARAVAADLAAPHLGLDDTRRAALADSAGAVVHAGAIVHWMSPYAALRDANVRGTLALLALAASRGLPFHHVSTISTAPADGDEDSTLSFEAALASTPYALSKWIAEEHVRRAAAAGLPAAVYRPAMIAGHTSRHALNPDDYLHRYIAGCVELGVYVDRDDAIIDLSPVDFVAEAIAALVEARPRGGGTYHLVNVDRSPTYAGLGRALVATGLPLRAVSYEAFRAALPASARLRPLAAFFPARPPPGMGPWPSARTECILRPLGVERPAIDTERVRHYVASLRACGALPAP